MADAQPTEPAAPPVPKPTVAVVGDTPQVRAALAVRLTPWSRAPTRIALQRRGPARLVPDGPDQTQGDNVAFASPLPFGVITDGPLPRIVADEGAIRLFVYVRREDARPVVVEDAALRDKPNRPFADPPRRGRVVLHPGAWIDVVKMHENSVRVSYRVSQDGAAYSGWIDRDSIGTTATMTEDAPGTADANKWFVTRRATWIRFGPGGKRLYRLEPNSDVRRIGRPRDGHHLVEYADPCSREVSFVGFVRAADLHQSNYGAIGGCGYGSRTPKRSWGDLEALPRIELERGRFLVDPTNTTLVGCVTEAETVADLGDGRYGVATIWGPMIVRLAPPEFEAECAVDHPQHP